MSTSHILFALRDKRARLAGEIDAIRHILATKERSLATVDDMLHLVDAGHDPNAIKHIRPYQRRPGFKHGELTKLTLDIMRVSREPLTAAEIARRIAQRKGIEATAAVVQLVRSNLNRLKLAGRIRRIGEVRALRWGLVGWT